ncbi:hypothetical protein T10_5900 [Trichinella papuae]|uniref:Uncharacterized protein n=1 Tax=Trichinella papuae TaxID=268474 RepID=A0A0V1MAF8_9BILA|nr:hypothetical protein T10_5900 [Trichinella papuae]
MIHSLPHSVDVDIFEGYVKFGLINACQFDKYDDDTKEELGKAEGQKRRDHFHSKTSLNGLVRPKMTNGYHQCLLSEQLPIES